MMTPAEKEFTCALIYGLLIGGRYKTKQEVIHKAYRLAMVLDYKDRISGPVVKALEYFNVGE